jgi:hypothetical protein
LAVFEDRVYAGGANAYDIETGNRTNWTVDLTEQQFSPFRWAAVPAIGVVRHGSFGFDMYLRQEGPAPVSAVVATVAGNNVELSWPAAAAAASYVIEAGTAPLLANIGRIDTGSTATTFSATGPDGRYYVRVRSKNDAAMSAPSPDLLVVLGPGACVAPPDAPTELTASVSGRAVTLQWAAPATPIVVASYVVEVSVVPGGAALARFNVSTYRTVSGTVPPGTYFVRVVAENACGMSGVSNEVRVALN